MRPLASWLLAAAGLAGCGDSTSLRAGESLGPDAHAAPATSAGQREARPASEGPAQPKDSRHPVRGAGQVQSGIDVLVAEDFARLVGRRVAILTARTGRDRDGVRTIDRFLAAGIEVVRLFCPEHGLESSQEGEVDDRFDAASGLEIHSLYGAQRRPEAEELAGIDELVVDLQDVGTRFYTYATTLGYAMQACAAAGVRVRVLDRPNPIAPCGVQGPIQDEERRSFIAWQPVPVVHGLTLGELARLYVGAFGIECELEVVPLAGWSRAMWYEDTGLPWIDPSPNLRNPTQALLYPALGLLEACALSVGRGTDQPFERLGAPWIDPQRLARRLRSIAPPGVAFTPLRFTPSASVFAGRECGGVHLSVLDREALSSVSLGLALAWALEREFPEDFDETSLVERLGSRACAEALFASHDPLALASSWSEPVRAFQALSQPFLLYP